MRYDAYEQKIKKIASVLKTVLRHIVKIIIAVALADVARSLQRIEPDSSTNKPTASSVSFGSLFL